MSRIGKKPITLPKGVEVKVTGDVIKIKGPKGSIEKKLNANIGVEVKGDVLTVKPKVDDLMNRKFHGLTRTIVSNMVDGVTKGFSKSLTLIGVGYRAALKGKDLNLTLGYSHPINFHPPAGIEIKVDKQTTVIVSGCDKEMVGQVAANIRAFRRPEPYHGKGVRYTDEHIATKVGKSGGKT